MKRGRTSAIVKRLPHFDVAGHFAEGPARAGVQIGFGSLCAIAMIAIRSALDVIVPTAGPFALVYPTVLLATLYGRWLAGIVAYFICFFWAWFYVLPAVGSFHFEVPTDPARVAINAFAALIVLLFAETFRHAGAEYAEERDAEIVRRQLLLEELDHRTKNNFALSVSLLETQRRRVESEEASDALTQAIGRLHSFASAYSNLTENQGEGASVEMRPYLEDVVNRFREAALDENVAVETHVDVDELPRATAVAIGLFTNEALTNCAKYAFAEGERGTIHVSLKESGDSWLLQIADNGTRKPAAASEALPSSGLGTRLFQAFANQADAEYRIDLEGPGCTVSLIGNSDEDEISPS